MTNFATITRGHLKRNLMVGVALAAVIVGVLIAALSSGGGHHHGHRPSPRRPASETQRAAAYLGLTSAELRRKERAGLSLAQIAEATAGKSVDGLLNAMAARRTPGSSAGGSSSGSSETDRMAHARALLQASRRRGHAAVDIAATYLGISEHEVRRRLTSGQSLAQLAAATSGHSVAGLVGALIAAKARRLELERTAGRISAADEHRALSTLRERTERLVHTHARGA